MMGTVLDEVMINFHCLQGNMIVTAEYTVRLRAPCPINQKILLSAWSLGQKRRLYLMASEARSENGTLIAEATATCMALEISK